MHRRFSRRKFVLLAPFVGVFAIAAFPAVAGAATPTPTPCANPIVGNSPCYTVAPTISPSNEWTNPPEGRILTIPVVPAVTGTPGTWSPASLTGNNFSYQWQDCDAATGLTCTNITGAVNRTYTVGSTDVGSRLQVIIKATNSSGTGYAVLESTGPALAAVPIDRVAPSVSGPTQDGQTLTANPGTWTGTTPITYSYQWRRCDSAGANCGAVFTSPSASPTYMLQDADLGHTMSVVVTATNSAGSTVQGSWAEAGVVTPGNTAAPTISGRPEQGQTLTESHGSWVPSSPAGFAYQWENCDVSGANCAAIPGATSQTYKLAASDVGHTVVVQESASAGGVTSSPATSTATGVVQGLPPTQGGGGNGGGKTGGGNNNGNHNNNGNKNNGGQTGGQGGSPSSETANATKIRALLMNVLALHGKGARIRALLKHGGYSFSFKAPAAGRLVIQWFAAGKHGKKVLVGRVTVTIHKTGIAKIELVLTGKGRTLLAGASRMSLTAIGAFTPAGHNSISASRTITLKR